MKLSTKSRYGVRLMTVLANEYDDNNSAIFLKDIAASEEISEKYLSLIVIPLKAAGLIKSLRGAHGGYILSRNPKDINLCDVVETLEGRTCLVKCVSQPDSCKRSVICPTRDVWIDLGNTIRETLKKVTLADLVYLKKEKAEKYNKEKYKAL